MNAHSSNRFIRESGHGENHRNLPAQQECCAPPFVRVVCAEPTANRDKIKKLRIL